VLTRQKVRGRVDYWRRKLGLMDYKLRVRFDRPAEKHQAHAWLWDHTYMEGELYFSLAKIEPRQLDAVIVHELSHLVSWPLAAVADAMAGKSKKLKRVVEQAEEETTVRIERLLCRAFNIRDAA
jgi:hypothetical protein